MTEPTPVNEFNPRDVRDVVHEDGWYRWFYQQRDGSYLYGVMKRGTAKFRTKVAISRSDSHYEDLIREVTGGFVPEPRHSEEDRAYL